MECSARRCLTFILLVLSAVTSHAAEPFTVQSNVVYGMYSGLALLMDVYKPAKPNGYGIVRISGSGWTRPLGYDAQELKLTGEPQIYSVALARAGYTVFEINHRAVPRFRYPAPVEDAQRAVRFIRHHARAYGIEKDRIGAQGGSSGGHLVSMLGTLDGKGNSDDPDPVERESAKVQCVVARAPALNLLTLDRPANALFLGAGRPGPVDVKNTAEHRLHLEASPVTHVTGDDAPFLLMHGDKDDVSPIGQSEEMELKLKAVGVPVKLLRIAGGRHTVQFAGAVNPPDYLGEMVKWFDTYLKK
jgi:acetyl esterase/lipase